MKRPAVFFDRDNTLIATDGYLGNPADLVLIEGAADAVAKARSLGFATVTFSNQSGVARGMFEEAAVHAVNARLDESLHDQNPSAVIDRHEFCPFHPDASVDAYRKDSDLRKPKPGMIFQAAEKLALDLSRSWVIGDAPRDIEAGKSAGCTTILFRDPKLAPSAAAREETVVPPDYAVGTLKEALAIIESQMRPPEESDIEPAVGSASSGEDGLARSAKAEGLTIPMMAPVVPPSGPRETNESGPVPFPSIPTAPADPQILTSLASIESVQRQLLAELRRAHEQPQVEFSVTKLLAGILQVIVLAVLFLAYLHRGDADVQTVLILALVLQTTTIAMLVMGR